MISRKMELEKNFDDEKPAIKAEYDELEAALQQHKIVSLKK